MLQMWRVRLCLAGGGREHVGYFANEEQGAVAYHNALQRLKKGLSASASPANESEAPRASVPQQPGSSDSEMWGGDAASSSVSVARRRGAEAPVETSGAFSHVNDHASVTPGREALLHLHVNSAQVPPASQFVNHQRLAINLGLGVVGLGSSAGPCAV